MDTPMIANILSMYVISAKGAKNLIETLKKYN
jgi:hypothetical protein